MGARTESEVDAVSTQVAEKAISVQPCTRTRTKEKNTEVHLRRLALGGQTMKNAFSCVEICARSSERESSQDIAS